MNAKIEALEDGWYRLPLAGEPVDKLVFDGTGKRPWVTLKLRDHPSFALPYRHAIELQLESAADISVDPIDDVSIKTTITPKANATLAVKHFDVMFYGDEEVEHMRSWMGAILAGERAGSFGHIVIGVRVALEGA